MRSTRRRTQIDAELLPFAERDELIARLSTSIAGGEPPDLFLMNYRYYGQFAARGALEPVGPYLRESDAFSSEDFFDTAMTPFGWDGEQMCLPQNVSSLVVYYNADLFEVADVRPADGRLELGRHGGRGGSSSPETTTETGRPTSTASAWIRRSSVSRRSSGRTGERWSTTSLRRPGSLSMHTRWSPCRRFFELRSRAGCHADG